MNKIQQGQNPNEVLKQLKDEMQALISKAGQASDSDLKIEHAKEAVNTYTMIMGGLTTIYKSRTERVETLKTEVRKLYEKAQNQVERYTAIRDKAALKAKEHETISKIDAEHDTAIRDEVALKAKEHERISKIDTVSENIGQLLENLADNIDEINAADHPEAAEKAGTLLAALTNAKDHYIKQLTDGVDPKTANDDFSKACKAAINEAKPTLETELGWGTVLVNLLKDLVNSVIKIVTFGQSGNFFKTEKSPSAEAVESFDEQLSSKSSPQ